MLTEHLQEPLLAPQNRPVVQDLLVQVPLGQLTETSLLLLDVAGGVAFEDSLAEPLLKCLVDTQHCGLDHLQLPLPLTLDFLLVLGTPPLPLLALGLADVV